MARPQNRKRQRGDDLSREQPPSKKPKSSGALHQPSNFPPEFYDNLPKVWLTPRALRELDWRNRCRFPEPFAFQEHVRKVDQAVRKPGLELSRFARTGGPNLCDLRGFRCPTSTMASSSTSKTTKTTKTTKTKRSSAYDDNFVEHFINYSIYPCEHLLPDGTWAPEPANLEEIRQVLKDPKGSFLSSETTFEDFRHESSAQSESTVMRNIVPLLTNNPLKIPNEGNLPFTNLASLTENLTVKPVPDLFDGAHPGTVDKKLKEDLSNIIVPTKRSGVPVAPNFFLEAKGNKGNMDVSDRQAMQDGAYGARLIHALQNYLVDKPVYDGKAYTFSATYVGKLLRLFAHHVSAPTTSGERPHYYMTLIAWYYLSSKDTFFEAIRAIGNLRMKAKENRDWFIEIANTRARGGSPKATIIEEQQDEGSSPQDFHDCLTRDEEEDSQETNVGLADDTEVSAGFATSFTSSFTSASREDHLRSQSRPKVPRSPPSPPSPQQSKKRGRVQE